MKIGIIGAGTMGAGIAQVSAQNGHTTTVVDTSQETLDRASAKLLATLDKLKAKGKFSEAEAENIIANIQWTTDLKELADANFVIEAIIENLKIKKSLFKDLESIVSNDCILASNTSSLSITSIASVCAHPERFLGVHFFNPAPIMKLVEIIPALQTEKESVERSRKLIDGWKKKTVLVKDTPGFIVNKVARPFYSEAIKMYEEGLASPEFIDWTLSNDEPGFRMGPFTLTDLIGHDVNYKVTETVWSSFYFDPRYKPSFAQKRLVEAGWLGKKSGRGFFLYPKEHIDFSLDAEGQIVMQEIVDRVVYMIINEASDTMFRGIATMEDIDTAMKFGTNYPKGPLEWANEIGLQNCVDYLDGLHKRFGDDRYRCCPLMRKLATENKKFN